MSQNSQGANAFATNSSGGGVGILTADPAASTNQWTMATPSNYQNWQSPDWLQSGLSASTAPITNYPITNYGRWNFQNGATNGYGMGASPWPAPSTLFGGSGSAGNGMPPPPAAGGGSKAGAGGAPPPPPAGGGTKAGGGVPPPPGGGGVQPPPPAGSGTQPPPPAPPPPPAGGGGSGVVPPNPGNGLTTNGVGMQPHLNGLDRGGLGQYYGAQRALMGTGGGYGTPLPGAPQGQGPMTWNPQTGQWGPFTPPAPFVGRRG